MWLRMKTAWAWFRARSDKFQRTIICLLIGFIIGGLTCREWRKAVIDESSEEAGGVAFGYRPDPEQTESALARMDKPLFAAAAPGLAGSWDRKTNVLLYLNVRRLNGGKDVPVKFQQRGTCVSMSGSNTVNYLQWSLVAAGGSIEPTLTSHAYIYGCAKEVMNDLGPANRSKDNDGLTGASAAEAVRKYGVVSNEEAGDNDRNDRLAIQWAISGAPQAMKALGKKRLVRTTSLVKTFDEVADAAANGYPTQMCSGVGFEPVPAVRDRDGFLRRNQKWGHGMCIIGVVNVNGRIGAVCLNSWDDKWISGPNPLDMPAGCFCIDEATVNEMLKNINPRSGRANYDSFAYSSFDGFPKQNPDLFIAAPARRQDAVKLQRPFFALAF
jgi:hypothetical protein